MNAEHHLPSTSCFSGDCRILTLDGTLLAMADIRIGQMLMADTPVAAKVCMQASSLVHCTPNHLFRTVDGFKRADTLMEAFGIKVG